MATAPLKGVDSSEGDDAVLGPLVFPQPRERRRAHVPVLRELEEMGLDDDDRLRPEADVGVDHGDLGKRTFLLAQREEALEEGAPQRFGEAGADAADVERSEE